MHTATAASEYSCSDDPRRSRPTRSKHSSLNTIHAPHREALDAYHGSCVWVSATTFVFYRNRPGALLRRERGDEAKPCSWPPLIDSQRFATSARLSPSFLFLLFFFVRHKRSPAFWLTIEASEVYQPAPAKHAVNRRKVGRPPGELEACRDGLFCRSADRVITAEAPAVQLETGCSFGGANQLRARYHSAVCCTGVCLSVEQAMKLARDTKVCSDR